MFVFRFECQSCDLPHGPQRPIDWELCPNMNDRPRFGSAGMPPGEGQIYPHQLCAVTADQFDSWWSIVCNMCWFERDTCDCFTDEEWERIPVGWALVAYHLDDEWYDIEWWEARNQIVFSPAVAHGAFRIGRVTIREVRDMQTSTQTQDELIGV